MAQPAPAARVTPRAAAAAPAEPLPVAPCKPSPAAWDCNTRQHPPHEVNGTVSGRETGTLSTAGDPPRTASRNTRNRPEGANGTGATTTRSVKPATLRY